MKQKTISLLLALALALSLAGCEKEEMVTAPAGVAVQVQTVEAQDIASENTVSGQVTAGSETSVYVTATAKCTAVYVEAGDAVKAGDVICSLDMESSLAQYRAAEIGYTSAASSYSDQKNILDRQVALYEKNWNDTKALFEIGAASQSEVDQMELQYLSTKAQRDSTLAQLEASMQSAKSSYEQLALAMENIDSRGNVIAPVDGVLASLTASEGGMVSPSYAVAVIDGAEQMKVTVMVSEALVPKLAIGDTVTVRVSAADAEFDGVIRSVEKTANQVTKLYTVTVTVPAEVEGLLSGIMLDTRDFTLHTGVRTFEAAAALRRYGAETERVRQLFDVTMVEYNAKADLVEKARMYKNCAISVSGEVAPEARVAIAQAANDLLTIQGVDASFVAVQVGTGVNVSARSLGAVNVQVIMESLGGGGHQTMAAAQLKHITPEAARSRIEGAIDKYYASQKKGGAEGK